MHFCANVIALANDTLRPQKADSHASAEKVLELLRNSFYCQYHRVCRISHGISDSDIQTLFA